MTFFSKTLKLVVATLRSATEPYMVFQKRKRRALEARMKMEEVHVRTCRMSQAKMGCT